MAASGISANTNRRRGGMMRPIMVGLVVAWVLLASKSDTQMRRPGKMMKLKEPRMSYGGGGELLDVARSEPQKKSQTVVLQARGDGHSHVDNLESDLFLRSTSSYSAPEPEFDESRLIDFGVVGFPKCGTTFLLRNFFGKSEQVFMAAGGKEFQELHPKDLDKLLATFRPHIGDTASSSGAPVRRGFKHPMVLMDQPRLKNLQDNFPTMKFVVTLRHPVSWFESFYNHRLREGYPMPPPHKTIGLCGEACRDKGPFGQCIQNESPFCSGYSNYHQYLSRMGYTGLDTEEELSLLGHHKMEIFNFSQTKLFLSEIGQMDGKNMTVAQSFTRTMERFLDLQEQALPDIQPYKMPKYTWTKEQQEGRIDICDDEYDYIRVHLLDVGSKAGLWIEKYFLKSPHVVVVDREDLVNRIRRWGVDPCKS